MPFLKGYPKLKKIIKFHQDNYYYLDISMYDWVSNNKMLLVHAILWE